LEIMDSWSIGRSYSPPKQSEDKEEYSHLKRTIYPFWQSVFHYKEWADENTVKKTARRANLKDRIISSLQFIPSTGMYKYQSPKNMMKLLKNKFPFCKF